MRRLRNWILPLIIAGVCVWLSVESACIKCDANKSTSAPSAAATPKERVIKTSQPNSTPVLETQAVTPKTGNTKNKSEIESACDLIEKGKFDEAGQLLEKEKARQVAAQLENIVGQWDELQKKRQLQQKTAYKKELAKFERIKAGKPADINDVNAGSTSSPQDANEPNGPVAILAAVIRTSEFADDEQKKELLSDPCVVDAVNKAKADAAGLESKGKWLDAYITCYSWLAAMEPNSKSYSDYADRLIEKAELAGGFQDSPCETSKQRFEGVKRRIFERAVDALNFNYVSKIDYRAMTTKGVRRCESLAEVVKTLTSPENREPNRDEPNSTILGESFKEYRADANALMKFCAGLAAMEQDINGWSDGTGKDRFVEAFGKMLELNFDSARLPEAVLIAYFADASFGALDPYTVIVWPTSVADFEKVMTNEFTGIGVEISKQKGLLTISSLLPDTPAYNSGLDAGDVIEKVDGTPTKDMPINCAVKRITGPAGTKVTLSIRHEGESQSRELTITRAKIVVSTIRGWQRTEDGRWQYFVDDKDKIGYVRLIGTTGFSEMTAADLNETLTELEAQGMRGLILDLRFNSGGLFNSAVEVADEFLSDGLIVITRPRFGMPTYEAAHSKGTHPNYPMVVLINAGSASASEIVAGALADPTHKRATLVGERTHGKGVVQGITHYPGEGAQLKYTMANYHLPSGQRVKSREEAEKDGTKDWGIAPDVTVEMRSDEFRKMNDIQRDNDVLVKAGHDNATAPVKRHTLEETIEADPQLETAILVVKSKLICGQTQKK